MSKKLLERYFVQENKAKSCKIEAKKATKIFKAYIYIENKKQKFTKRE